MKILFGVILVALVLSLALVAPALAKSDTLPENASFIAFCATNHGGQHVADCAQTMERGVSACAKMSHAECGGCNMPGSP